VTHLANAGPPQRARFDLARRSGFKKGLKAAGGGFDAGERCEGGPAAPPNAAADWQNGLFL
jgi:hypothetical protein